MTRIFTDGAELGNYANWSKSGGEAASAATDAKRSGSYAYKCYGWGYGYAYLARYFTALSECYLRIAFYLGPLMPFLIALRSAGTEIMRLSLETTYGHPTLYIGGTLVDTGSIVLTTGTWYVTEWHLKIANDATGLAEIKFDGVPELYYSGDTQYSTYTTVNNLIIGSPQQFGGGNTWYDDIAFNDITGSDDNSWCGDGKIILLRPNAAGDVTQLTPSTGSNYACVDEVPHNSDTDYVEGDTLDEYDLYNLAASGLTANDSIKRITPVGYFKDTVADGGKVKLGIKTDGTEYWSADRTITTAYTEKLGDDYLENPYTSSPWTSSELDSLQVGIKDGAT